MWDRNRVAGAIKRVDAMHEPRTADPSRACEQYRACAEKRADFDYHGPCRKRVTDPQQFPRFFAPRPARNLLRQAQANVKLLGKATLRGHLTDQIAAEYFPREPAKCPTGPAPSWQPLEQTRSIAARMATTNANPRLIANILAYRRRADTPISSKCKLKSRSTPCSVIMVLVGIVNHKKWLTIPRGRNRPQHTGGTSTSSRRRGARGPRRGARRSRYIRSHSRISLRSRRSARQRR